MLFGRARLMSVFLCPFLFVRLAAGWLGACCRWSTEAVVATETPDGGDMGCDSSCVPGDHDPLKSWRALKGTELR